MNRARLLGTVAAFAASMFVTAEATTLYDFTGQGYLCNFTGEGMNCPSTETQYFHGMISVTVNPAGPGINALGDGVTVLGANQGWVTSGFWIYWNGGSFEHPGSGTGIESDSIAAVFNNFTFPPLDDGSTETPFDELTIRNDVFAELLPNVHSDYGVQWTRHSQDVSWLNGLDFPESAGFAPGSTAENSISIFNYVRDLRGAPESDPGSVGSFTGWSGVIDINQLAARQTVAVPEPISLALFGLGICALSVVHRRRRFTDSPQSVTYR